MTEATDEEVAELRTRFRVNDYGVVSGWIVAKLLARLEAVERERGVVGDN